MGNTKGYIPQYQNFYPPPHTISVHGLRHLAFEHLALHDPEPFCPLGTPVNWTILFRLFPFQMQSDLTVIATGISILLQYLNHTLEPNEGDTWTMSATRCENVEEILKGCSIILQCCGNTAYLSSVYRMWQIASNSVFLFEQRWWPEQRAETALNIDTPPVALKLSALLRPGWREQARLIRLAMASLVRHQIFVTM